MDKEQIFQFLSSQDVPILVDILSGAYDEMSTAQRKEVFDLILPDLPIMPVDGKDLLKEIKAFSRSSLAGHYYASFNINSKNFMHVPEETEEWFDKIGDFLKAAAQLTTQGDHEIATLCFAQLYTLINKMEDGEEIVFADELGSWMIPVDEEQILAAYLTSQAAVSTPEAFVQAAIPLVRRDSYSSLANQVYTSAMRVGTEAQQALLAAEVKRLNIRVEKNW